MILGGRVGKGSLMFPNSRDNKASIGARSSTHTEKTFSPTPVCVVLWQIAQLGCENRLPGLCVTSVQYEKFTKAANLSKVLSQHILQNWSVEFDQTLRELRTAILQINSTHLDLSLTEGFVPWISSALSYFKEWVGVGLFGVLFSFGLVFILWLLCKFYNQTKRDKMMMTQALVALEQGASAGVWLAALKQ